MSCYAFDTDWGWAAIKINDGKLTQVFLPISEFSDLLDYTGVSSEEIRIIKTQDVSIPVINRIRGYFRGEIIEDWAIEPVSFSLPAFTEQVLHYTKTIPYGSTKRWRYRC